MGWRQRKRKIVGSGATRRQVAYSTRAFDGTEFHEAVASLISGSRSGWVGTEFSAPKIYDVWRRKSGRREGKVNKNLREITVPGGKLRLVSPVAVLLLPFRPPRSSGFPSPPGSVLYSTHLERSPIIESSHDVSSAEERLKTDRNVFHFLPEGFHGAPQPRSSSHPLSVSSSPLFRRLATTSCSRSPSFTFRIPGTWGIG